LKPDQCWDCERGRADVILPRDIGYCGCAPSAPEVSGKEFFARPHPNLLPLGKESPSSVPNFADKRPANPAARIAKRTAHDSPSPSRRVALLAITQRTIHISRRHIAIIRLPRKSVPTTPKTLGDHIHLKRYEKRLLLSQVAEYMGVTTTAVKSFESDVEIPNEREWQSLQTILGLDPRLEPTKPNT
jgi:hypothetical protein